MPGRVWMLLLCSVPVAFVPGETEAQEETAWDALVREEPSVAEEPRAIVPGLRASVPGGGGAGYPCEIILYDSTIENGIGAEPGVVREFVSVITVPAECQLGGAHFLLGVGIDMTRTAGGSPKATIEILARAPVVTTEGGGGVVPGAEIHPPMSVNVENIPLFPNTVSHKQLLDHPLVMLAGVALPAARWNGDAFPEIFLGVDESAGTPFVPCFTTATPTTFTLGDEWFECELGLPNILADNLNVFNSAAISFNYLRGFGTLIVAGTNADPGVPWFRAQPATEFKEAEGGTWNIAIREGSPSVPGPIICQFFNVPLPFDFQCPMTPAQVTLYHEGNTFMEADEGGGAIQSPMVPANHVIFFDGFESGDTFFWSNTVP